MEVKVLLISANRTEINMRTMPLGLACVAQAARREGHTVGILDLVQTKDVKKTVTQAIKGFEPDI